MSASQNRDHVDNVSDVTMILVFGGNCKQAIARIAEAFDGRIHQQLLWGPQSGTFKPYITYSAMDIGDAVIMAHDDYLNVANMQPTLAAAKIRVPDVDATFKRAVEKGFKPLQEPKDMFWGARVAHLEDPWGNRWTVTTQLCSTKVVDMEAGNAEFMKTLPLLNA